MGKRVAIAGRLTLTPAERHYAADIAAICEPNESTRAVYVHYAPILRAGLVGLDRVDAIAACARRYARARLHAEQRGKA